MASKVIILHPGEQVVLPSSTVIDELILIGSISVSSTCNDLPVPTSQQCYAMQWGASVDAASNYTLEHSEAFVNYIKIGGVQYDIGIDPTDPGGTLTVAFMNVAAMAPGIFDFVSLTTTGLANRYDSTLLFKSVASIAAGIELNITGDSFPTNGLFVRPFESEDCP